MSVKPPKAEVAGVGKRRAFCAVPAIAVVMSTRSSISRNFALAALQMVKLTIVSIALKIVAGFR